MHIKNPTLNLHRNVCTSHAILPPMIDTPRDIERRLLSLSDTTRLLNREVTAVTLDDYLGKLAA